MDLEKHKKKFENIIRKYNLQDDEIAEKISKFLTNNKQISYEEFSKLFKLSEEDSKIFITFIIKGIKFKEKNIDKN